MGDMYQVSTRIALLLAVALGATAAHAEADPAVLTPYADLRYRLEVVDQDGLPETATASTLRIKAGVRTAEWQGFSALVEGEAIARIGAERYNDTVNGKVAFPVVPDRADVLLNQAYLRWKPVKAIEVTVGRQAVNLDNQRWIGSVGWRQNDQTLDAARLALKPLPGLAIDYLHAWRVNRVFGPDSPQGIWRDTAINGLRAAYVIKEIGTLSGYGYWLDIPSQPSSSTRTLGVRIAGERGLGRGIKLLYAAEYARQHDLAGNPRRLSHDYLLLEPGLASGGLAVKAGLERLGGNGVTALQTPLATLHAFNGWADKFLVTPPGGLRDIYLDASYRLTRSGPLKGLAIRAVWHDFSAVSGGADYGREWNGQISYPINQRISVLAKFARYEADRFGTDTTKGWFAIEARF